MHARGVGLIERRPVCGVQRWVSRIEPHRWSLTTARRLTAARGPLTEVIVQVLPGIVEDHRRG
jgi:hypothetical protein